MSEMAPALSIITVADACHQYGGQGRQSLGVNTGISEGPIDYVRTVED